MKTFHRDVYMPAYIKLPSLNVKLNYSHHAKKESVSDRYGKLNLPEAINLAAFDVIEATVENGEVVKLLLRGTYDNLKDMCLVIIPQKMFVKTVWFNLKSDKHRTLNKSRYATS